MNRMLELILQDRDRNISHANKKAWVFHGEVARILHQGNDLSCMLQALLPGNLATVSNPGEKVVSCLAFAETEKVYEI